MSRSSGVSSAGCELSAPATCVRLRLTCCRLARALNVLISSVIGVPSMLKCCRLVSTFRLPTSPVTCVRLRLRCCRLAMAFNSLVSPVTCVL